MLVFDFSFYDITVSLFVKLNSLFCRALAFVTLRGYFRRARSSQKQIRHSSITARRERERQFYILNGKKRCEKRDNLTVECKETA